MNLLAIDTSGNTAGVALLRQDVPVFSETRPLHRTHSTEILAMIDEALRSQGMDCSDMDAFACVTGPGSFTGLRIGASTVKGFAHATGKPCIGIHTLEALAAGAGEQGAPVLCPMLDARSHQVYAAAFAPGERPERLLPDMAASLDAYLDIVEVMKGPLCFVGDGAVAHAEEIRARLGERAIFAEGRNEVSPVAVARLAALAYPEQAVPYLELMPYYLRAPQAERERLEREACHGA